MMTKRDTDACKLFAMNTDDPEDTKPADWVDEAKITDPHATKPADWDEDAVSLTQRQCSFPSLFSISDAWTSLLALLYFSHSKSKTQTQPCPKVG